ncbi:MAG: DnaJ domain-containing protein, partial [Flavobacteriales bacterium]
MTNYFNILGIPESASIVEIKSAYRKLAKEH